MADYNFTDKKITPSTTDRRRYYAPTPHGQMCPLLKLTKDGKVNVVTDVTGGNFHDKCACAQSNPFCSYHLGDEAVDEAGEKHFICHRYLAWSEHTDKTKEPVDTHERQLKLFSNRLGWY